MYVLQQNKKVPAHYVQAAEKTDTAYNLFTIKQQSGDPIVVHVELNSIPVKMELDTGASVSVLSYDTYQDLQCRGSMEPLQPSSVKLKSYTGDAIPVIGSVTRQARYCSGNVVSVLAQVVDGDGPNLLGRDSLINLRLTWDQFR